MKYFIIMTLVVGVVYVIGVWVGRDSVNYKPKPPSHHIRVYFNNDRIVLDEAISNCDGFEVPGYDKETGIEITVEYSQERCGDE